MNGKPEWFQLIEGDEIKPRHQVKRALRVMALAAPLFVLGTGFVLAQTQDGSHAIASETVSLTSTAPESSTAPLPSTSSNAAIVNANHAVSLAPPSSGNDKTENASPARVVVSTANATSSTSQSTTITAPSIKRPTGGEDDEDDEEDDD
ncbi:MAG: hypothetical protein AABY37_07965 [Actinomycetota bacterium]